MTASGWWTGMVGVVAVAGVAAACSGAAGRRAGGGDGEPVLEPAPPSPRESCEGPPLPALTTRSDLVDHAARLAEPRDVYAWSSRADADLGIGHLSPEPSNPGEVPQGPPGSDHRDWPQHIVYPLFDAPGGEHIGWFDQGWVVLGFGYDALHRQGSGAGHVETGYEATSLVVLDTASGGWYRIRHTEPRTDEEGTAWVHRCHLTGVPIALAYESWEDRFRALMRDDVPVFFRSEVRHSLRAGASTDSARVAWIPADADDSEIHVLEIAGDWMRVSVQQPRTYCSGDDADVTVEEGWIKWRDEEKGPWVWWYTRGC
jgi:hypothetical protein